MRLCPDADVVVSGVGMAETAATIVRLASERKLGEGDMVVLCGIAGAYGRDAQLGEVVEVVEECCVELPERFRCRYDNAPQTTLRGVRSNTVHRGGVSAEGAEIENMEGAALFAVAENMAFKVAEIRALSNYVGDNFAQWCVEEATDNLARALKTQFNI